MKNILRLAALYLIFSLWAGLFAAPSAFAAYGSGLQKDKYPQFIPSAQFQELAREEITRELTALGETRRYELVLVRAPRDMRCPAGTITTKVSLPQHLSYGSMLPVFVEVRVNDVPFRRAVCYYRINVFERMAVANHDLLLEKILTANDVRMEERAVASQGTRYITDASAVNGKVPTHIIREGTPLTEGSLQNPITMEVGAAITLITHYNGVEVRTEGVALQRGRVGTVIRVRNLKSGKTRRARVLDAATVEVL